MKDRCVLLAVILSILAIACSGVVGWRGLEISAENAALRDQLADERAEHEEISLRLDAIAALLDAQGLAADLRAVARELRSMADEPKR